MNTSYALSVETGMVLSSGLLGLAMLITEISGGLLKRIFDGLPKPRVTYILLRAIRYSPEV